MNPRGKFSDEPVHILVVDDDPVILELFQEVFTKMGLRTLLADGSKKALELIQKTPPDVVLLDVKMPDTDGITTLKEIKSIDPTIQVIIMTGCASVDSVLDAMRLGAFDYLEKPFDRLEKVVEVVRRAWEKERHLPGGDQDYSQTNLERRLDELKFLCGASQAIGSCLNCDQLLLELLDSYSRIIDCDVVAGVLLNEHQKINFYLHVVQPCTRELITQVKLNLVDAFNSIARIRVCPGKWYERIIRGEKIQERKESLKVAEKFSTFLNVPLISQRETVGMININTHCVRAFTPDEVKLMYDLAQFASRTYSRIRQTCEAEKNKITSLVEHLTEGVMMFDGELELVMLNPQAQKILPPETDIHRLDGKTVGEILNLDLGLLKERMKNKSLDFFRERVWIGSTPYQVVVSQVKSLNEQLDGLVVSLLTG